MDSTLFFSLIIIIIFVSSLSLVSSQSQQYDPPEHYFINCGSSSDIKFTGKTFLNDENPSTFSVSGGSPAENNNNNNPETADINKTARVFTKQSWYKLEADDINTFVVVRLYFSPFMFKGLELSSSKFNVSVLGFTLLSDFSAANGVIREFIVPIGDNPKFKIEFIPLNGHAFVNAIEAFTGPKELFKPGVSPKLVSPIGEKGDMANITSSFAFNPIYRINVGGERVGIELDSLMRRTWIPDDPFIFTNRAATNVSLNGQVKHQEDSAARYDAPDDVYGTAKQLNKSQVNITRRFNVSKSSMYLVRAHFCDIVSIRLHNPEDAFNFFVYSHFKLVIPTDINIDWQLQVPFYADLVVESVESEVLNVSIGVIPGNNQTALLNGLEIMKLLNNSGAVSAQTGKKGSKKVYIAAASVGAIHMAVNTDATVAVVIVGVVIVGVVMILCLIKKLKQRRKRKSNVNVDNFLKNHNVNVDNFLKNHEFLAPKKYSYSQVKKMTNSFKVKLGEGGFGSVYRGELSNGNLVAVKVLNELKGNGEDFINEVASVGRTSHVNIVTLVGFCCDGHQRALIYEFMPNGSLERFIYGRESSRNSQLGWEKLHQIAIGIARGLEYLHSGCNTRILHFDIKPHNILLNKDFLPKISDVGLAKLYLEERSMISMSRMRGTPGYIAPELYSRSFGQVSHKSDVYSYGMMVLEMVGGRKNIEVDVDHTSEIYFPHWIYKKIEVDEEQLGLHEIVSNEENEMVRKMIIVGLWCIQTNPLNRPAITKVLEMLEGDLASLEIPPKPYLSSPPRSIEPPSIDESNLNCSFKDNATL